MGGDFLFDSGSGNLSSQDDTQTPMSSKDVPTGSLYNNPVFDRTSNTDISLTETAHHDFQDAFKMIWSGRNKHLVDSDDESTLSDHDDRPITDQQDLHEINHLSDDEEMLLDQHDIPEPTSTASQITATSLPGYDPRRADPDGLVRIKEYDRLNEDFMMGHVNRG
jgi:hypothetical protein